MATLGGPAGPGVVGSDRKGVVAEVSDVRSGVRLPERAGAWAQVK
jgi:hypothetical protein